MSIMATGGTITGAGLDGGAIQHHAFHAQDQE
jgi:hypothetical protein